MKIRKEIMRIAELMERKLQAPKNRNKEHWCNEDLDLDYLIERIEEEVAELKHAFVNGHSKRTIVWEAVDVANFAMMIVDITDHGSGVK